MFRYRVRNIYGWSSYSPIKSAIAAKRPDRPDVPLVVNTGTSVAISWTMPYNGGSSITKYNV